jgi:hypothetical protein
MNMNTSPYQRHILTHPNYTQMHNQLVGLQEALLSPKQGKENAHPLRE